MDTLRQKIFKKYWYFKLAYGRASSYLSIPMAIISFYAIVTMWLKLYLKIDNTFMVNIYFAVFFILFVSFGYLEMHKHINREEISFNNSFNPEIQHLIKKAGGEVQK